MQKYDEIEDLRKEVRELQSTITNLKKTVTELSIKLEKPISKKRLAKFLRKNNLLEEDPTYRDHPAERYWPDESCQIVESYPKNNDSLT